MRKATGHCGRGGGAGGWSCKEPLRRLRVPLNEALLLAAWALALSFAGCNPSFPPSDHFDGDRFFNPWHRGRHGCGEFLKWRWTREAPTWPNQVHAVPGPPPPRRVQDERVRHTVVNHSTVLIQVAGVNVLADPIWSERCSPVSWAGPRRVVPPGIAFDDLPPIDIVLVSHNHYDHMDLPSLRRLSRRDRPLVLTGLGNGGVLRDSGIRPVVELDWWQGRRVEQAEVCFVPAQHFSKRGLFDTNRTLWGGFVIRAGGATVYFAGDTGYAPFFQEIRRRYAPIDLAFLPIGAYKPRWFMRPMHLSPGEAVRAHLDLGARRSVGIHFGTFPLADDAIDDPPRDLLASLASTDIGDTDFIVPKFGAGYEMSLPSRPRPTDAVGDRGEVVRPRERRRRSWVDEARTRSDDS